MTTFSDFALSKALQRALKEKGFESPTPIQAKSIPQILGSDQDLMALAQTGTGKTAAFSLPVLSQMEAQEGEEGIQTLILSPTRELAMQIADDMRDFSKYQQGLSIAVVYGGAPIQNQIREIKRGAKVIVGTPGRMLDLIKRKVLKLKTVKWAILDEADEMLNMGFIEDISSILAATPEEKQTLLFSATMSKDVEKIANKYMHKPERIEVEATPTRERAITHLYMMVPARDRITALRRYRDMHPDMYGIVFCRTKRETQEVGDAMMQDGHPTGVLHGDIEQKHRTRIMKAFKDKKTTFLVATDVAARGIDVSKLTHVIHMGVPDQVESYVHRSGRTGRANEQGISIVIANLREHRALRRIEKEVGIRFEEVPVPSREDSIQADIDRYVSRLEETFEGSEHAERIVDEVLSGIPPEDLGEVARRALLIAVKDAFAAHPEEGLDKQKGERRERGSRRSSENMVTLVINQGHKQNITVPHLLGMINEVTRGERVDVGDINIGEGKASFEVDEGHAKALIENMSGMRFKGKAVSVSQGEAVPRSRRGGGGRGGRSGGSRGRSGGSRGGNRGGGRRQGGSRGGSRSGGRGGRSRGR